MPLSIDIGSIYYALSATGILLGAYTAYLVFRMRATFATKDELKAVQAEAKIASENGLVTARLLDKIEERLRLLASKDDLNEEARKRRDLNDKLIAVVERVNHLPTAQQAFELMRELEKLAGEMMKIGERVDGNAANFANEIRAMRDMVGQLQNTISLWTDSQQAIRGVER